MKPKIHFSIISLFPEALKPYLDSSMLYKAQERGIISVEYVNLRDFGLGPHKSVDDTPYGGGDGMLLRCEPVFAAIEGVKARYPDAEVILPTPVGMTWSQALARQFAGVSSPKPLKPLKPLKSLKPLKTLKSLKEDKSATEVTAPESSRDKQADIGISAPKNENNIDSTASARKSSTNIAPLESAGSEEKHYGYNTPLSPINAAESLSEPLESKTVSESASIPEENVVSVGAANTDTIHLAGVTPGSSDPEHAKREHREAALLPNSTSPEKSPLGRIPERSYIIICPHYEGYDERIMTIVDHPISLGNYVLTGGELPALILVDSITRLLPGVLGGATSAEIESFSDGDNLEYPQYTKPADFRGLTVPDILLSGHHANIAAWRAEQSRLRSERAPKPPKGNY